jgi:hypothetical protein
VQEKKKLNWLTKYILHSCKLLALFVVLKGIGENNKKLPVNWKPSHLVND